MRCLAPAVPFFGGVVTGLAGSGLLSSGIVHTPALLVTGNFLNDGQTR